MFKTGISAFMGMVAIILAIVVFIGVLPVHPSAVVVLLIYIAWSWFEDAYTSYKENKAKNFQ